jgi:hypothetical protein
VRGLVPGLKPEFVAVLDVRDKSRTYLRGKSKNVSEERARASQKQEQERFDATEMLA